MSNLFLSLRCKKNLIIDKNVDLKIKNDFQIAPLNHKLKWGLTMLYKFRIKNQIIDLYLSI